jgi:Ca2+-binding RTX toxin-like protein
VIVSRSRIATLAGILVLGAGAFAVAEEIEGTDEPDTINGTAQADQIEGGRADDTINGLGGDDTLDGSGDNDKIDGGEGNDKVFGAGCEVGELGRICDNVGRDTLLGGLGDDDLRANECMNLPDCQEAANVSLGTRQRGGPGNDKMLGAEKRDVLRGGGDNDNAQGFLGRDKLKGGPGDDRLDGGGGRDRVNGGSGKDRIEARDGKRDRVRCGKGRDRVFIDSKDRVRGCERVVGVG